MEELSEFLEQQREINTRLLQEMLSQQSLLLHNLHLGLNSLKKCVESIPKKIQSKQCIQSRVTIARKMQHESILQQFGRQYCTAKLNFEGEMREIYRERVFNLPLSVTDLSGNIIEDEDCPIILKIYSTEKFPKEILTNIKGKPILKGETKIIMKGKGEFSQIAITEVSSHFPSGKFIIVILPEKTHIKPLLLDNVIVKAKRIIK